MSRVQQKKKMAGGWGLASDKAGGEGRKWRNKFTDIKFSSARFDQNRGVSQLHTILTIQVKSAFLKIKLRTASNWDYSFQLLYCCLKMKQCTHTISVHHLSGRDIEKEYILCRMVFEDNVKHIVWCQEIYYGVKKNVSINYLATLTNILIYHTILWRQFISLSIFTTATISSVELFFPTIYAILVLLSLTVLHFSPGSALSVRIFYFEFFLFHAWVSLSDWFKALGLDAIGKKNPAKCTTQEKNMINWKVFNNPNGLFRNSPLASA